MTRRLPSIAAPSLAAGAILLALSGCGGGGGGSLQAGPEAYGAPDPEQAVHGFLGALRANDYPAMARHFGTESGPAEGKWGVEEVEQRMLVLAGILEHRDADLQRSRRSETDENRRRFVLSMTGTRYGSVTLPVVAVRASGGRWFVERIETSSLNP